MFYFVARTFLVKYTSLFNLPNNKLEYAGLPRASISNIDTDSSRIIYYSFTKMSRLIMMAGGISQRAGQAAFRQPGMGSMALRRVLQQQRQRHNHSRAVSIAETSLLESTIIVPFRKALGLLKTPSGQLSVQPTIRTEVMLALPPERQLDFTIFFVRCLLLLPTLSHSSLFAGFAWLLARNIFGPQYILLHGHSAAGLLRTI